MRKRQKWMISVVTAVAMVFSSMGTAVAAEQVGADIRPTTAEQRIEEVTEKAKGKSGTEVASSSNAEPNKVATDSNAIKVVHKHDWSSDWWCDETYHWHECEADDCPIIDDNEKSGYEEHRFDDGGVCAVCEYTDPAKQIMLLSDVPTYQEAYEIMIALKDEYPEGTPWTNFTPYGSEGPLGDSYLWKGGPVYGGSRAVGCMAFAFVLSDAVFGNLPSRATTNFTFEDVKVGDILRVRNNSHSVIVLQKSAGGIVVAEGNYNKTVHWGRVMSVAEVEASTFVVTRYPEGYDGDDMIEEEVIDEGDEGDIHWTLTNTGLLTISGSGAISDYAAGDAPWGIDYYTIVIDEGITRIGEYAFYNSKALAIYMPDTVSEIGVNAFYGSKLLAVTFPESVRTIEAGAFRNCESLVSISVAEGVETIGDNAFRGCMSLEYVDFPSTIISVGAGAFMDCQMVTRVRFAPGNHTVSMGDNVFTDCWRLDDIVLPEKLEKISNGMFESCQLLYYLYIPAGVTAICDTEVFPIASPFKGSAIGKIEFGGSEADWQNKGGGMALTYAGLSSDIVTFNVAYDDPFAVDPDDPGDFIPDDDDDDVEPTEPDDGGEDPGEGDEPCVDHVDADGDGMCDNCGKPVETNPTPTDPTDPEEPTEPTNPAPTEPTNPDDEKDETWPGGDDEETQPGGDEGETEPDVGEKPTDPDSGIDNPESPENPSNPAEPGDDEDESGNGETLPGGGELKPGGGEEEPEKPDDGNVPPAGVGDEDDSKNDGEVSDPGIDDEVNGSVDDPTDTPDDSSGNVGGSDNFGGDSGNNNGSSGLVNRGGSSSSESSNTAMTTVSQSADGTQTEVYLSESAVNDAKRRGEAVVLPIAAVVVSQDVATAPTITIHTNREEPTRVAIPVSAPTAGTVIVIVKADGSTEIVKSSVLTEAGVAALLSDGATVKVVDNTKTFVDVPADAWFADAATFVAARELLDTTSDGAFAPEAPATYMTMVTALARLAGVDTTDEAWFEKPEAWLSMGVDDVPLSGDAVSCEDLVMIFWQFAGSPVNLSGPGEQPGEDVQEAMAWAVRNGIIDSSWDPKGQLTRAQMVWGLMNLVKAYTLGSK